MPITFRVDYDLELVEARFFGDVTIQEVREANIEVFDDPTAGSHLMLLAVFDGLRTDLASEDFIQYQDWRKRLPRFRKIAFVAPTDYEYGIARMFASASNQVGAVELSIFRDLMDARAWLGLPES